MDNTQTHWINKMMGLFNINVPDSHGTAGEKRTYSTPREKAKKKVRRRTALLSRRVNRHQR